MNEAEKTCLRGAVGPSDGFAQTYHALQLSNCDTIRISSRTSRVVLAKDAVLFYQYVRRLASELSEGPAVINTAGVRCDALTFGLKVLAYRI
jgi:hypothetical protein